MANLVLVHGAMHGGWCWRDVRPLLTAEGHTVFTPTLTGQGDRRHLLDPSVGVDTHVDDLAGLLWYEDLHDVHLVLHSYAGILAGPVAERAGDRLASIVFLGAFLARPGQCLLDVEPPEVAARYRRLAATEGDGWRVPTGPAFLEQWGVVGEGARAWIGPRLTDFPLRCTIDVVAYDPRALDAMRKAYVRHTDPPLASLAPFYEEAVRGGWETHELACGHDMMLVEPAQTAALLDRLCSR